MSANAETLSAQEHASNLGGRGRTIALAVVALAFVMDLLDSTIVNIAIPSIQANLGASYTTIQWLIAGYSLTFALLLITGGRMGDVFGYKKLFMIGVAGFTVASLLSGLAWSPTVLVIARLIQGSMAALMVPQVISLMQVMYKPEERGSVMGLFGALGGLAASLGPIIGGLLIQANIGGLDWRPIFLINVPVGILGLILGAKYLPEGKSAHPLKLDIIGTVIVMVALSLLIFPLIEGRELDWPTWIYLMMAASIPVFILFAWWQRYKDRTDGSPLVLPALFHKRSFSLGLIANIIFEAAMLGFFFTFTLTLQAGLGFSVLHAALTGIPLAVGITVSIALISQKLIHMIGRYAMTLGTFVMASGLTAVLATITHGGLTTHGLYLAPGLFLVGMGMGMIMMPVFSVALNDVDHNHAGSASGTLNAVQQVGGAIGIALIGVVFFGQLAAHSNTSFNTISNELTTKLTAAHVPVVAQDEIIENVQTCFNDRAHQKDTSVLPESCQQTQIAPEANQAVATVVEAGAKKANANNFVHAFRAGYYYELIILGFVFILSFFLPRHIREEALEEAA